MTLFIDLRADVSGGVLAAEAGAWDNGNVLVSPRDFARRVAGRHVLFATHGFNVDRRSGIVALTKWDALCQLPSDGLFVGVLWPGDARFIPVIDYPFEGPVAKAAGQLLAGYLNRYAGDAASISLASHSLGARTVLEAVSKLDRPCRRLVLMADAIEDDCLSKEYADAAGRALEIFVLASKRDAVLEWAFPAGNLVGTILTRGYPYHRAAIGRPGPARPISAAQLGSCWQIPESWDYGHLDYLPG